jgi:hypothetical protein
LMSFVPMPLQSRHAAVAAMPISRSKSGAYRRRAQQAWHLPARLSRAVAPSSAAPGASPDIQ